MSTKIRIYVFLYPSILTLENYDYYSLDHVDGANQELDGIKLQNDASEATVDDLINLPYLHEPAILHCLQNRSFCSL